MTYRILHGDVLSFARHYHGELFHALIADSPYNLESISKRFKNPSHKDYEVARSNPHRRTSGGFMNAKWDSDIAFHPETWEAFSNLLYPGAFIMVFGGSRTSHRLACAIEDAGFILHPTVHLWAFGSGFPKATRIDTQIDRKYGTLENDTFQEVRAWIREKVKAQGLKYKDIDRALGNENSHKASHYLDNSQPQLPTPEDWAILKSLIGLDDDIDRPPRFLKYETDVRQRVGEQTKARKSDQGIPLPGGGETEYQTWDVTEPTTDIAKAWMSYRYGLQALKPAVEPIIVAQKPYIGRPIDSITTTGAGALNIDAGGIVGVPRNPGFVNPNDDSRPMMATGNDKIVGYKSPLGRWPSNLILQHSSRCKRVGEKQIDGYAINRFTDGAKPFGGGAGHEYTTEQMPTETIAEWECVPECAVRKLGEQSGTSSSNGHRDGGDRPYTQEGYRRPNATMYQNKTDWDGAGDSGTASRFFYNSSWEYEQQEPEWNIEVEERLLESDPVRYEAKSSSNERSMGLEGVVKLRSDLSEVQKILVLGELERAGVRSLG